MADKIQFRRDTTARWASVNPILLSGEIGLLTDSVNKYKLGDGVHTWNELPLQGFNGTLVDIPGTDTDSAMSQKGATDLVSEYNVSANNNNAEYTFAQAVAFVPVSLQKGGLTIKYIDSTTHEYAIKRLMSSTWNTTESNWQGIDDEPTAGSNNLVKSGGVYEEIKQLSKKTYNLVPVNSSDELYDRSTVHLGKDLRSTDGVEVDAINWNCSPFIPVDINIPLYINAYENYLFLYDSNQSYIGRFSFTNGRTIASYGSQYLSTAYLRILYNNTMLYTARIGLTEHENLVKDYFIYDIRPVTGSDNLVPSGAIYKFTNGFEIPQGGVVYDYPVSIGDKLFIKNTGTVDGLSVSFYEEGEVVSEVSLDSDEYIIYEAQLNSSGVRISAVAGVSAIIYEMSSIGGKVAKAQEDITNNKEQVDNINSEINGFNVPQGGVVYDYPVSIGDKLFIKQLSDIQQLAVSFYNDNTEVSYIRIDGGESVVYTATANTTKVRLSGVSGAHCVIYKLADIGAKVLQIQDNPILIRIATFNVGDYTGKNLPVGDNATVMAYRNLLAESNVNIFGTQGDTANFGGSDIKSTFWQLRKYYNRFGNSNYNYKAFASDYEITDVKQVFYTNTEQFTFRHPWFLVGVLYINGRTINLCSFHFDWSDNDTRHEQIRQVIEYFAEKQDAILMGDTNCENYINEQPQEPHNLYDVEWSIFTNAGYSMVNNGYFGVFKTVGYDEETQYPLDNIFTKGHITIRNANIIVKDWTNDHCILYADLAIY